MQSAPDRKAIKPEVRERAALGATKALISGLLTRNPKEVVRYASTLTLEELRTIEALAKAGNERAAQFWSVLHSSEAQVLAKQSTETLSYLLDEEKPPCHAPKTSAPPKTPEPEWKSVVLSGPKGWKEEEEVESGWRDYTQPIAYFHDHRGGQKFKQKRVKPLPTTALPSAQLVRALSAHKRMRSLRHPDGDIMDFEGAMEVAARIPGSTPWMKEFNRPSTPHLVVLVDCSGSMGENQGMEYANYAATVIGLSAMVAKCPFTLIGYIANLWTDDFVDSCYGKGALHSNRPVKWRPGTPRPTMPVEFRAGGGNDMMGATINATKLLFSKPDNKTRRIIITISDSDIASSCYVSKTKRGVPGPEVLQMLCKGMSDPVSTRAVADCIRDNGSFPLYDAYCDMVEVLAPAKVEAHAMFVGSDINEKFLRGPARGYVDRYRSAVICSRMSEMSNYMNELAVNILSHA